jgi:4-amino-4-deoxy-L-arabinose transferase-like glycosyltransferase
MMATAVLVGLIARELGVLCWVALLYTLVVALVRQRPRLWLVAGVIAGVGLETKYTIAFLVAAILVSLLATPERRILRTRWPWLGLGFAILLLLLASQVALAWKRLPAADRADGTVVAGNYGEASALEHYGPERGLPPVLSGHLSWQYWRPSSLPQRFVLFVGYGPGALAILCRSWRKLATIDNHWHLANEERGRIIAGCHLKQPLGTIWDRDIARNNL